MRPQPIPVNVKIIVVGTPDILGRLDRNEENLYRYACFVAAKCRDSALRPLDKTAVARVIDYSSRLVGHQQKLTTRFMEVAEIVTEANYWAGKDDAGRVLGEHVKKAIDQRKFRISMSEDHLRELIEEGTIQYRLRR